MRRLSLGKTLLAIGALAVVGLAIGLAGQGTAKAQPAGPNVPTEAEVTGCTPEEAPNINWKWELPDVNSAQSGMQYGQDDDPALVPASPPSSHNMIQMFPNLEDLPEARKIEYCAAVEDPNGIPDIQLVKAKVFHPDGTEKYTVTLTKVSCASLGDPTNPAKRLGAAVATGQMTVAEAENIIYLCEQQAKAIYCGTETISKHQPPGEYRVLIQATDTCGGMGEMENWFDVLPIVGLEIDFDLVDWGPITPGVKKIVQGDTNWNPPSDAAPTVKNTGNAPMFLFLNYSKMTGASTGEAIESFDGTFLGQTINPIAGTADPPDPAEARCFSNALGSNETAKLDLSVNPPTPLSQDVYSGSVDVWGSLSCP
jgi:hypothetical protein